MSEPISGQRPLMHVPRQIAQAEIKKIIDTNPAFKSSVDNLIAHSTDTTTPEKKREKAILFLYSNNPSFKADVDAALESLKGP